MNRKFKKIYGQSELSIELNILFNSDNVLMISLKCAIFPPLDSSVNSMEITQYLELIMVEEVKIIHPNYKLNYTADSSFNVDEIKFISQFSVL